MERRYRRDACDNPKTRLRLSARRLSRKRKSRLRRNKELGNQQLSVMYSSSVSLNFNDKNHQKWEEFSNEDFLNDVVLEEIERLEIDDANRYMQDSLIQNKTDEISLDTITDVHASEDEFFNDVVLKEIERIEIDDGRIEETAAHNGLFEASGNRIVDKHTIDDEFPFHDTVVKNIERIEVDDANKYVQDIPMQNKISEISPKMVTNNHAHGSESYDDSNHVESIEEPSNESFDPVDPTERCVINILYFMNEIKKVFSPDFHQTDKCSSNNIQFIGMKHLGLRKQFKFHCHSCNETFNISSEPEPKHNEYMDINTCAVAGTKSSGTDYSELEEIFAYMGIRCMAEKTYHEINDFVQNANIEIADNEMRRAGAEERKIAEENNCREGNYLACTVKIDGTWCTRSYGSQGRSKSGATVIVGKNTNKILFYGVRNKYCQICAQAENRNEEPRPHRCYKNWSADQSSCAMESDAAVEGFMRSIEDHQLVYTKVISDKDSSVYLRLLQANPYNDIFIEKLDCVTHLLCNVGKELKKVAQMKTGREGTDYKKALLRNICRIRYDIQAAAKYRVNEENYTFEEKILNLQKDIRNVPYHVFGQHDNCDEYFCDGKPKENEINIVTEMMNLSLFQGITNILDDLCYQAESLINNENTNIVESINSIICKKIGAKRKNKIQRGAYNGAVALATIHVNTRRAGSALNDFFHYTPPTALIDMETRRIEKNSENVQKLRENKSKRKYEVTCSDDEDIEKDEKQLTQNAPKKQCRSKEGKKDYGKNCQKPDMKLEELNERVCRHYETLQEKLQKNKNCTANSQQSINTNHQRFIVEKHLLMDRHFGEICRMRSKNYGASTIKKVLCPSIRKVLLDKYERTGKTSALENLRNQHNIKTKECGLFIHRKIPYLAALPDGITSTVKDDDTVVIIECPYKAKNVTPDEAIERKIEKVHSMFNEDLNGLNENHHLFYRLIGAMEITGKTHGLFVLWTKKGIKTVQIKRNKEFWMKNMEVKLTSFYEQKLIPEIIDSRTKRNMPIRTNGEIKVIDYKSFCSNQNERIENKTSDVAEINENCSNDGTDYNKSNNCLSDEEINYNGSQILYETVNNNEVDNDEIRSNENDMEVNSHRCPALSYSDNNTEINNDEDNSEWNNQEMEINEFRFSNEGGDALSDEFVNSLFHINNISQKDIDTIRNNEWLSTDHMDYFARIMKAVSNGYYDPEYTAKIQIPDRIRAVCPLKSHIQILHNGRAKHWVCSFYDTEKIYIYDSFNSKRLREEERIFLERLYPYYDFDNNPVIFPDVQHQRNFYSCGEFSIAFATTLMYGLKPENVTYDRSSMRPHLIEMLLNNRIEHFPREGQCKNLNLISLQEAIKTAQGACQIAHDLNIMNRTCLCGEPRSNGIAVNTDETETIVID